MSLRSSAAPDPNRVIVITRHLDSRRSDVMDAIGDAPGGRHIVCSEIDSSGPLFGMTLDGKGLQDEALELEIMVPVSMVKLVMLMHGEHEIGFV